MNNRIVLGVIGLVAAVAITGAACGGKQKVETVPPPAPDAGGTGGDMYGGGMYGGDMYGGGGVEQMSAEEEAEVLALFEQLVVEVCACADRECLEKVMVKFGPEFEKYGSRQPSAEGVAKIEEMSAKMQECAMKAAGDN